MDRVKIDSVCVHENWRKDLYESIKRSEKFIYLSIPSLNPKMCLFLNGGDENKSLTIGELLSEKRNEGKVIFITNTLARIFVSIIFYFVIKLYRK